MPLDAVSKPLYVGLPARYVRDGLIAGTVVRYECGGVVIRHADGSETGGHHPRMLVSLPLGPGTRWVDSGTR